jgi:hypothetical protein
MQGVRQGRMPYQRARDLVTAAVAQNIEVWANTIGLHSTRAEFAQFREDVTETLHACMRVHITGQNRRYERFADMREDFLALADAATAAAKKLRVVERILKRLPPMQQDPAFRLMHDPHATAFEQDGLAEAAHLHADECKRADRGGQPRMRALEVFADGLVRAYRNATGRSGVGRGAREGELLDLYEAVLPTACDIAEAVTGTPLEVSDDPGDYLHRIASRD